MTSKLHHPLLRYGFGIASIALATWVRRLLDPALGNQVPLATIFFAVLLTAWYGGLRPAVISVVLGALAADYFLLPPQNSFSLEGFDQQVGMGLYLCTGFGMALLGGVMHGAKHRAERAAQAEHRQAVLIDQTYDAIVAWQWDGPITFWNRGAERLYGIPRAEAVGRVIHDLLHTHTDGGVKAFVNSLELEGSWEGELAQTSREGTRIILESRMVLVREAEPAYVLEINRDISKRRKAEAALRDANEQLEARVRERTLELARTNESIRTSDARMGGIVNSAMDAIISVDSMQHIVLFNAAAEKMFRCSAAKAMGQPLDMFIPQRFREQHHGHVEGFGKTGVTSRSMHSLGRLNGLRPDGEEFPIEASISQVEVGGEKIFTVILRDLTERQRAENAIRQSEDRLDFALQVSGTGAWDLDLLDHSAHRSLQHDRIFGYQTLLPIWTFEMFMEHVLPEDRSEVDRLFNRAITDKGDWSFECRIRRCDGEARWIWASGRHRFDESGVARRMAGIVQDITERKQAEGEVRRLNEGLEQRVAQRTAELRAVNNELEAFSYSVSHDLRAPLRHINGFSQALLEDYEDKLDDAGKGYLHQVRGASQEMAQLIDDVLQLARVSRAEMQREPVNLSEMASRVISDLRRGEQNRSVVVDIEEGLATQGDKRLMQIMLINLLGNAWKFTSRQEGAGIAFGQVKQNGHSFYFVRDNGAGFDMAYVGKLFRAFQRLHTAGEFEGTGIGLATVQRIVNRHGGRVWAEGKLNEGATFYFTLPGSRELDIGEQSDPAG